MHQPVRDVLAGESNVHETVVAATNRRGKSIHCRLTIAPLLELDGAITGAIMLVEESAVPAAQG